MIEFSPVWIIRHSASIATFEVTNKANFTVFQIDNYNHSKPKTSSTSISRRILTLIYFCFVREQTRNNDLFQWNKKMEILSEYNVPYNSLTNFKFTVTCNKLKSLFFFIYSLGLCNLR